MAQVGIVSGIYADAGYRLSYPVNYYPVVMDTGLSKAWLRPTPGVEWFASGSGADRGSIVFNGMLYRVSGTQLMRVYANGVTESIGVIPGAERVAMAKSFDRICLVTAGRAWYWSEGGGLVAISDPDFSRAIDVIFIDGYFLFVDETFLFNSDLANPSSINPLSFGSAEVEGDPIVGIAKVRNEPYVCGTETIEVFQNVGGAGFPFQRVPGAMITKGICGRFAKIELEDALFFVGAGRGEGASVYLAAGGQAQRVSTDEIDQRIQALTDAERAGIVCETYSANGHLFALVHLPEETLAFDVTGSKAAGAALWHVRRSDGRQYRPRGFQYVYGCWLVADAQTARMGSLSDQLGTEYGSSVLREFATPLGFVDGRPFIVHAAALHGAHGVIELDDSPRVSLSVSRNGVTWSQERLAASGRRGQHDYQPRWRQIGHADSQMSMRFRTTSSYCPARLEITMEALNG